ncbi:MAG: PTS cellobiose transporter subunit IIC [Deltaproteobacteria bacterium]|nr:MAG: PTS cellobiose transporter subunit IIC [Deltaproteobacteria bacterium]
MKLLISGLALILVLLTRVSFASEVTTLESLIKEALQNNPDIKEAKAKWEASTKRPSQEGSLPDPIIGIGWRNVSFDRITLNEEPMSMVLFSFMQEFPFPGKLSLKEKIALEEARAQEQLYKATLRKVIADLKEAYYDWFLIDKSIEITQKNKDLLEKFLRIAETKYTVGEGIQQDVLKAQVEISRFIEQLELLKEKKETIEARLRTLLNRPPDSPLGKPQEIKKTPFSLSIEELYKLTQEKAPLLKAKEKFIKREEKALELAKKEYFPDFVLGAAPGVMGMSGGGVQGVWEVTLGIKVPLYFWRKQKLGIEEEANKLEAARQSYTSTTQTLFFELKNQYLIARTSENLLKLFEEGIIPQATLSLESAIAGYQVGNIDFLTLLDNLITLFNFELAYYTHLTNYQKALARIEEIADITI